MYEFSGSCAAVAIVIRGLEPIAAIGKPPAGVADGDRRGQRPPERKRHVGNEAEYAESDPKYFPLHVTILNPTSGMVWCRQGKVFQIEKRSGMANPVSLKRIRNDSKI
jgi:hypothetical protein